MARDIKNGIRTHVFPSWRIRPHMLSGVLPPELDSNQLLQATRTGLEPVISYVTGRCPNQLDQRIRCNRIISDGQSDSMNVPYYEVRSQIPTSLARTLNPTLDRGDLKLFYYKSGWRDLNPRPLAPHASALPTALHPDK